MPRKRQETPEMVESDTLPSRVLYKLSQDKDLKDVVKRGSGSLFSSIPYYISTQCATLDYAIGRPGIPASRLTTIFGPEGSGKSTLAQHILAETQRIGGVAVLIDSESRFSADRATSLGLNVDDLIIVDGASMEQTFAAIHKLIDGVREDDLNVPVTIVYDSLAGSVPEKRLEADAGSSLPAIAARLVGQELPRLHQKIAKLGVALVIINQLRSRIDVSDPRQRAFKERRKVLGDNTAMLAERPLLYHSSLMLNINPVTFLGDKESPSGIHSRAVNRKCSISPREQWQAEFDIDFLSGIDQIGAKFDLLEDLGVIKGAGGRYRLEGEEKSFYRKDFPGILAAHPELEDIIKAAPLRWLNGEEVSSGDASDEEAEADSLR